MIMKTFVAGHRVAIVHGRSSIATAFVSFTKFIEFCFHLIPQVNRNVPSNQRHVQSKQCLRQLLGTDSRESCATVNKHAASADLQIVVRGTNVFAINSDAGRTYDHQQYQTLKYAVRHVLWTVKEGQRTDVIELSSYRVFRQRRPQYGRPVVCSAVRPNAKSAALVRQAQRK